MEEPRYLKEALLLANSYAQMLEERERLEKAVAGNWTYTKDMAISELDSITVSYDGERVQTSNISNPTERIAMKLTDEYMAKKQREMDAERDACVHELEYVSWKIDLVKTVLRERLDETQRAVVFLLLEGCKTYRECSEILKKKMKIKLVNRDIARVKETLMEQLERELESRAAFDDDHGFIERLCREARDEYGEQAEGQTG